MTSNILQAELSTLIQESKRKYSDLKNAAEQSLTELKALPSTSEAQLVADLARKPQFVKPFVLACQTRHARLAVIGVANIQRLVAFGALPPERLKNVLDGLHETVNLSFEVQLKVLQTLPSLLQHYSDDLNGDLLSSTLGVCATLQNNKTPAVSNTAAATLQQLVVAVFEKISKEDEIPNDNITFTSVSVGNESINVSTSSYDAFRILDDLCRLVEGEKLKYLGIKSLSKVFVLELIESILVNNDEVFARHPEHAQVLRHRLMPLAVRYMSERHTFSLTVRVARILQHVFKAHISLLTAECEMALALLIHLIDTDTSVPWKRVLCMEVYRNLYMEPGLLGLMYTLFDEQEGRKNILRDHMSCLVRIASERPSLIGVSHQSTMPTAPGTTRDTLEDQVALEAVGVTGVIGGSSNNSEACGISHQWSLVRIPYVETLDKLDNPSPPDTYIYSLVLNCISAFSESMAKFIIPLTVAESKSKRKRHLSGTDKETDEVEHRGSEQKDVMIGSRKSSVPLNPLDLKTHPQIGGIKASAGIIEACWPAILATSSTFLYAALDREFYHNLVRAFQKLTHVAGLLRLSTPRDAFLTTLGKAGTPSDHPNANPAAIAVSPGLDTSHSLGAEHPIPRSPSTTELATSSDNQVATLNTRNLLCLRALLNLGIALGPTLDRGAWSIILETLQLAELVLSISTVSMSTSMPTEQSGERSTLLTPDASKSNLGAEIMAVQTAANKMIESTGDYPNISFKTFLSTLLSLAENTRIDIPVPATDKPLKSPSSPQPGRQVGRIHQNKRNISIALGRTKILEDELKFVLGKVNDVAKVNIQRLSLPQDEEGIWDTLMKSLVEITRNDQVSSTLRVKAGDTLHNIVLHTIKLTDSNDEISRNEVQRRGFLALKSQTLKLYERGQRPNTALRAADMEIHELALETLKSVLEGSGQFVVAGWDLVFDLISSVFDKVPLSHVDEGTATISHGSGTGTSESFAVKSPKLLRISFSSLQLVASDFISLLPPSCLLELIDCFYNFASQKEDFNTSLTTTTFFWNISDFLRSQIDTFSTEGHISITSEEESIIAISKGSSHLASRNALWLLLLLKIVDLTVDSRTEVRNSAIHTIIRILDHYGEQLDADAWHICLNKVLFVMAESVQVNILQALESGGRSNDDKQKSWVDTGVLLTKGLFNLIASFFDTIVQHNDFHQSWTRLLQIFAALMKTKSLDLNGTIFASFTEVLSRIPSSAEIGPELLQDAWSVWVNGIPVSNVEQCNNDDSNQEALLAYLQAFEQLYRLLKIELDRDQVLQVLNNFHITIRESTFSKYSSDLETQSELQHTVIKCMKTLCLDKPSSQPAIINCLSRFSDMPLMNWSSEHARGKPTFVAFSKAAMQLMGWYISDHGMKSDILSDRTLNSALERLASLLLNKYIWPGKDCVPTLWQTATTTSLNILQVAIPYVEQQYRSCDQEIITHFWQCVVNIVTGIVSCGDHTKINISASTALSDQDFDIAAFERLRGMVIPSLGSPFVPDNVRRDFAFSLFSSSLIYSPKPQDSPIKRAQKEPLHDLYKIRRGRTYDPPPTIRTKLSYVLIDTLFDLVSAPQPTTVGPAPLSKRAAPYISLAKSVSPYLILRCALPLKAYIADQPLRGLMPQPMIARNELLYHLNRLVELKSEPDAIPPAGPAVPLGNSSDQGDSDDDDDEEDDSARFKKHLGWMFPLVVKGVKVAGKETDDTQVLDGFSKILEGVSGTCLQA